MKFSVHELYIMQHRGEIIRKLAMAKFGSIAESARQFRKSRGTLYRWFDDPHLPDEIFLKLGRVMGEDLRKLDPSLLKMFSDDPAIDLVTNYMSQVNKDNAILTVMLDGRQETLRAVVRKLTAVSNALAQINNPEEEAEA